MVADHERVAVFRANRAPRLLPTNPTIGDRILGKIIKAALRAVGTESETMLCSSQPVGVGQRRLRVSSGILLSTVSRWMRNGSHRRSASRGVETRASGCRADSTESRRAVGLIRYSRPTRSNQDSSDSSCSGAGHTGHGRNMTSLNGRHALSLVHSVDRCRVNLLAPVLDRPLGGAPKKPGDPPGHPVTLFDESLEHR